MTKHMKSFVSQHIGTIITVVFFFAGILISYGIQQEKNDERDRKIAAVAETAEEGRKNATNIDIMRNDIQWIKDFLQKKYVSR